MRNETKDAGVLLGFVFGIAIAMLLTLIVDYNNPDPKDRCEDVGGIYLIIGQEYSAATKTTVDVYGCVKGSGA